MLFELRMRFIGDEGDEAVVMELVDQFEQAVKTYTVVRLLPRELRVISGGAMPCHGEGRRRKDAAGD